MKKSLYILPFAALALASCSNTEDLIFDGSAAERLEQGRTDAMEKLTADGGLWEMEYFSNDDEPGYVMLFRFNSNGSVEVSADHKWIGSTFKQETSLWDVASDNGNVLTFNTYNSLFHIFSDPADITGPNQPTNPDRDDEPIDETGYGHEGDYEFQVMQCADHNTMRLLGKKRGYNIYMHRLPADTDEAAYLAQIRANEARLFSAHFPKLIFTDLESGEEFVAHAKDGKMNIYPLDGDSITQAREKHFVVTTTGMRFSSPFEVLRADGSEYEVEEFTYTDAGGLKSDKVTFRLPIDNYEQLFFDRAYTWTFTPEGSSDSFVEAYNEYVTAHNKKYPKYRFSSFKSTYDVQSDSDWFRVVTGGKSSTVAFNRYPEIGEDGGYRFNIKAQEGTTAGATFYKNIPMLATMIDMINSHSYKVSYRSELAPDIVTLTALDDADFYFVMTLD